MYQTLLKSNRNRKKGSRERQRVNGARSRSGIASVAWWLFDNGWIVACISMGRGHAALQSSKADVMVDGRGEGWHRRGLEPGGVH